MAAATRRRTPDVRALVAIFAGGALGGAIRTGLEQAAPGRPGAWPSPGS